MSRQKRTYALDFDGVLHEYDGYKNGRIAGPIEGARDAVDHLLLRGHQVVVFSTRDVDTIKSWLQRHGFPAIEVTNVKRPFYVLVDDRAVRFDGTWSERLIEEIETFEPYWIKRRDARDPFIFAGYNRHPETPEAKDRAKWLADRGFISEHRIAENERLRQRLDSDNTTNGQAMATWDYIEWLYDAIKGDDP